MTPITAGDTSRSVAQMFNLMDRWRHLPGYRLEGRLAPFFELFLRDVLAESLDVDIHPVVIPEFPLRKGTLLGENGSNQSYNVDYVAFSDDRNKAFLVELKTDMGSIDDDQKHYLINARNKGIEPLVWGILKICGSKGTRKRSKYVHLLHRLAKLELVKIPDQDKLYRKTFPAPRRGWTDAFKRVKPAVGESLEFAQVIYILPECQKDDPELGIRYIDFCEVANIVQKRGELGYHFANYLRQWIPPAGGRDPRDVVRPR